MPAWRPMIVAASALALSCACAEAADPPPAASIQTPAPVKTGKERLSDKASDEQRVDNCKVPPEKRGTKIRPDACPAPPPSTLTN